MTQEDIRFKLEIIRGPHGNPLLLVKFDYANNFVKTERTLDDGQILSALTWIPTNDEAKLLSDTLRLLNSLVTHLEGKKIYCGTEIEIGHD